MKHLTHPTQGALVVKTTGLWQYSSTTTYGDTLYKGGIEALWYRKEKGKLTVYLGEATCHQSKEAASVTEWLEGCSAPVTLRRQYSFNGATFRPRAIYEEAIPLAALYIALSEGRTDLPDGYQGWWKPRVTEPARGFGHTPRADDPTVALCGTGTLLVGVSATTSSGEPSPNCPACTAAETAATALQNA